MQAELAVPLTPKTKYIQKAELGMDFFMGNPLIKSSYKNTWSLYYYNIILAFIVFYVFLPLGHL